MSNELEVSKLSKTMQDVMLLFLAMDEHDRLKTMAATALIPGLSRGKTIKALAAEIEELFTTLAEGEKRAVIAYRQGNYKVWAKWFWQHVEKHPDDARMLFNNLAKFSPWWYLVVNGATELADKHFANCNPIQWQEAKTKGDRKSLDDLLFADNSNWHIIIGR
ncbi:MAG: hypothetical protein K2X29_13470 [Candidatus Obscuribacterales bacterium]|nr:hypothetical protein [Candidatus Obscuribacterales bacterium]